MSSRRRRKKRSMRKRKRKRRALQALAEPVRSSTLLRQKEPDAIKGPSGAQSYFLTGRRDLVTTYFVPSRGPSAQVIGMLEIKLVCPANEKKKKRKKSLFQIQPTN